MNCDISIISSSYPEEMMSPDILDKIILSMKKVRDASKVQSYLLNETLPREKDPSKIQLIITDVARLSGYINKYTKECISLCASENHSADSSVNTPQRAYNKNEVKLISPQKKIESSQTPPRHDNGSFDRLVTKLLSPCGSIEKSQLEADFISNENRNAIIVEDKNTPKKQNDMFTFRLTSKDFVDGTNQIALDKHHTNYANVRNIIPSTLAVIPLPPDNSLNRSGRSVMDTVTQDVCSDKYTRSDKDMSLSDKLVDCGPESQSIQDNSFSSFSPCKSERPAKYNNQSLSYPATHTPLPSSTTRNKRQHGVCVLSPNDKVRVDINPDVITDMSSTSPKNNDIKLRNAVTEFEGDMKGEHSSATRNARYRCVPSSHSKNALCTNLPSNKMDLRQVNN